MPTAAKLIGAIAFAALGWAGAWAFMPLMPPETRWGIFQPVCAALGLLVGWRFTGARVGRGWIAAMGAGLTGAALLVGLALLVFSFREMVHRSMNFRYDGPLDAVVNVFGIVLEYGVLLGDTLFLSVLVLGGLLGGLLAEAAARLWR